MPYTKEFADEVLRLLASGLSQRRTAVAMRCSRSTVYSIASGRWKGFGQKNNKSKQLESPSGPAVQCPVCRSMVQMPCVACRTRLEIEQGIERRKEIDRGEARLAIQLLGEDRERYEQLRKSRPGGEISELGFALSLGDGDIYGRWVLQAMQTFVSCCRRECGGE